MLGPVSVGIITGKHYANISVTKLNDRAYDPATRNCNKTEEPSENLVEYNHHKKEELKHLNEQITMQDVMEHKPRTNTNNYVYASGLSLFALAIGSYLLYSKFKKPERSLIDVPAPPMVKTNTEPKRDIFEML